MKKITVFYEQEKQDKQFQKEIVFPSQKTPFLNILCVAKKNSGKTNIIWNIIQKLCNKYTQIKIIQKTKDIDNTKKSAIKKLIKDKTINEKRIQEQYDINKTQLTNLMDEMNFLKQNNSQIQTQKDDRNIVEKILMKQQQIKKKNKKMFPEKDYLYPYFCLVFDDCASTDFKILYDLIKTQRHYNSLNFYSTQNFCDLQPKSRSNINILILFGGQNEDRLQKIWDQYQFCQNYQTFENLYKDTTAEKYQFLAIDLDNNKFYKNLQQEYILVGQ